MKKFYSLGMALVMLMTSVFSLSACQNNKAEKDPIDDNYRVLYQIFVGSFSDSNGDGIGDLRGIINRLDYLNDGDINSGDDLGVQALWLSPIFTSPTYHKYDTTDYYSIDPSFGTMSDLEELIQKCHERNVLVVLDMTLNHTSTANVWFQKFVSAHNAGDTSDPYYDFYSWATLNERRGGCSYSRIGATTDFYECNFDTGMPELNMDNSAVVDACFDVCKYYLDLGIDGFRFDAAKYIYYGETTRNVEFWKNFIARLKAVKADIYTVGEVWSADTEVIAYNEAMNCFDFTLAQAEGLISKAAAGKSNAINNFTSYVCTYLDKIEAKNEDAMLVSFISNHDMDRAAGYATVSTGNAYMAANLYLLCAGSPVIYYGEEIGLKGTRGSSNTDANRRLAMLWGDGDTVKDPIGANFSVSYQINGTVAEQKEADVSILKHYQKVIAIRNRYPAIARGEYTALSLGSAASNAKVVGGFQVDYEGETLGIIHNVSSDEQTIDLSQIGAYNYTKVLEVVGVGDASLNGQILTLEAKTSVIIQ